MSDEQKRTTAKEFLAKGWEFTQQSMAFAELPVPNFIEFQCDGANHIRATRIATVDELAKAISALDEDIGRRVRGAPALIFNDSDIEQLRQEKAALIELRKRCGQSEWPGTTTVIESLFPDVPVKKKTASEKAEIEKWLQIRKDAGLKLDSETAEVDWSCGLDLDPTTYSTNGNFRKNSTRSGASIGRVLPEATSGFISAICPIPRAPICRAGIHRNPGGTLLPPTVPDAV